jgi:hypothetical protein
MYDINLHILKLKIKLTLSDESREPRAMGKMENDSQSERSVLREWPL